MFTFDTKTEVSEGLSDGILRVSTYPSNLQEVFEGWNSVLKYLNRITNDTITEPSTKAASIKVEKPFGPLIQNSGTKNTERFLTAREQTVRIINGNASIGETITLTFSLTKPDKIVFTASTKPISQYSYTELPYTRAIAQENEIDINLSRQRRKCYGPIIDDKGIPGSIFTISFTKLSDEYLGIYVSSDEGYLPDSALRRWLYKKLI